MEPYVIKCLGQRLLADPALQHFYAVLIAHDARFLGAGAQGVNQLGGPPMGMHVDHGSLLSLSSNGLTSKVSVCATLFANYRQSIPTATAKQALSRSSNVRLA
jgi:hypothetical protein